MPKGVGAMKRSVRRTSIIGRLGHSTRTTAIMLLIPALASLAMMFLTTVQYQRAMSRMETAAGLKPIVGTQLPEQLFSVAAGRLEYDDSGADDLLGSVNETLDRLLEDASTAGTLELTVARRTMDTLAGYLGRLRDGMAAGAPVGDMERIVDEVREKVRANCGVTAISTEGREGRNWVLIDFGSVVVHVFKPETRDFYRLEKLWGDAPEVDMGLEEDTAAGE